VLAKNRLCGTDELIQSATCHETGMASSMLSVEKMVHAGDEKLPELKRPTILAEIHPFGR
jgi:hypothetical protein